MIEVRPKDSTKEEFDNALNKFTKKVNKDGFLREIKDRRYFKKPSEKRREEKRKSQREIERNKKNGRKT